MSRRWTIAVVSGVVLGCGLGTAWAAFSGTTSNGANSFSVVGADITAPTIARATVAKAAGGSAAGTVRQGADYYVYAEVTDGVGVNTVTTNTSSFDTGVTAASLSASGGPWTVSGQSYNYRSATLTANTGLTTGSTPAYTITATDLATNQAGPTSFNATIETYNSVITGTSGLVSYWRLGESTSSTVTSDTMTGSAGTTLQSHTGETGANWSKHALATQDAVISDANRVRKNGSGWGMYYASGTPGNANYSVSADVHVKSLLANDMLGVIGRWDTTNANGTYYLARYEVSSAAWNLIKVTNGSWAFLGSYGQTLTAGSTYNLTLDMSGTTIRLLVDGVQRVSLNDGSISGAGKAGIMFGDDTVSATVSNTAGLHLDNFTAAGGATAVATDSAGSNNGTYTNGPTLGIAGALAGDSNTAASFDGTNDYITVPDANSLDLGDGPLTLEAWVRRSTVNTNGLSIFQKGASAVQFGLFQDRTFLAKDNIGTVTSSTTTITDTTTWHHLVTTKSGSTSKLYIDGVDRTGSVTNQTMINTTSALILGAKNGTSEFLPARLDEMAIYNQALSAATVLDHYRAGAGTG